jgi:tripeptide aminopeptidase
VLGADDLAGVTAILEAVRYLHSHRIPHRAAEILFTSQEEIGLQGSRHFAYERLRAREGITLDMTGAVGGICVGGPSQANFRAVVLGKAAHAGLEPEKGISAIRVAAEAIAAMPLGRIDSETTANIGMIHGGEATNIVTARVELKGEARSHSQFKLETQAAAMTDALHAAAQRHGAQVDITLDYPYQAYRLAPDEPIVQAAMAALRQQHIEPYTFLSGGGSDVNLFAAHGLRVANLSIGYQAIHTLDEHIAVADIARMSAVVTALLTIEE